MVIISFSIIMVVLNELAKSSDHSSNAGGGEREVIMEDALSPGAL